MRQAAIDVEPYRELAEHLPVGRSFRDLAAELGRSHEYWRAQIARESAGLIDAVEVQLRANRVPIFEVPPQDLAGWQRGLTLAAWAVEQLRRRGWLVVARPCRLRGADPATFAVEIVYETEEES